jgi:uncharacterized protein (TIGR00369 family)
LDNLPAYRDCLFCGPDHPHGLRLKLRCNEASVVADLSVDRGFQGYENTVHGGIVSGILDEVMWWAVTVGARKMSFTRKIEVEFLRPMACGEKYRAEGRLTTTRHGAFTASGQIEDGSGRVIARAEALFMAAKTVSREEFARKMDLSHLSPEMLEVFSAVLGLSPGP